MSERKDPFENKCNRCGKLQKPFQEAGDFKLYGCKEKCECGGTFVTYYEGKPIEKDGSEQMDARGRVKDVT